MTRPNTMFAEPRELPLADEATAGTVPEIGAERPSPLPSGAELLLGDIATAIQGAQTALSVIRAGKHLRDKEKMMRGAADLVQALACDPKALARQLAKIIEGVRL